MNEITMTGRYFCRWDDERKYPVEVFAVTGGNPEFPVVARFFDGEMWMAGTFTPTGRYCDQEESQLDLIECSPWETVAVDTPVWVWCSVDNRWLNRHFAKYEGGEVWVWDGGRTSHTAYGDMSAWNKASLTKPEGA